MEIKIKRYSCYCALETFTINSIEANHEDFGFVYDAKPEDAPEYGCGSRIFEAYDEPPSAEVLAKYEITADDIEEINSVLEDVLYMGQCGLCA